MSTRARVGIENEDGSVTSVYTHSDGYPEHHAPILTEHYGDEGSVRGLLALGDLSILAPKIGDAHVFSSHDYASPDCLAYGRDRGEEDVAAVTHPADDWPDSGQEYEYFFKRATERWAMRSRVWDGSSHGKWKACDASHAVA